MPEARQLCPGSTRELAHELIKKGGARCPVCDRPFEKAILRTYRVRVSLADSADKVEQRKFVMPSHLRRS